MLPTAFALGGTAAAAGVVGGFWYYATPKFYSVGYMPKQPGGGFNHQIHAGKLGLDCRYCHTKIEVSAEANIPNVATCYGCHRENGLALLGTSETHKQKTEFIRQAYAANESIPWRRVHKVPDYVRNFPHNVHLKAGVSCYSCHGRIDQMPVVYQSRPLSMSWCLDCHRAPELHVLQDRTKITDLQYAEDQVRERSQAAPADAKRVIEGMNLKPPENCGACHY